MCFLIFNVFYVVRFRTKEITIFSMALIMIEVTFINPTLHTKKAKLDILDRYMKL